MITTLTGSNTFLLQQELSRQTDAFLAKYGDIALERVDGEEASYQRIVEAVQALPFLADKRLIVLHKPSAQKEFTEKLEQLLDIIPDSNDVLIIEPKLDKRSSYFKNLKKLTSYQEYNELDTYQLADWLVKTAKERKATLKSSDARYLIDRVGANQQLLDAELRKLITYDTNVTRQSIELLCERMPQSTIFQLLDAAFSGDKKRVQQLYEDQRSQGVDPMAIVPMIAWQLHVLSVIKAAGQKSQSEIVKEAKISPFVLQKTTTIAKKIPFSRIKQLVHELHILDIRLKSTSIDADEAIQYYLLQVST
ncbi:MAG: DNA polymerase III subunit delta [Candidatus Saccharibacteria bacterium]|nr:DNA polymerase III subunit delta [Candidatus Saccharibacteria bacterium]